MEQTDISHAKDYRGALIECYRKKQGNFAHKRS
jgi:hypothetical protein